MSDVPQLRRYVTAVRRWWTIVVAAAIVGGAAGFLSAPRADADPLLPDEELSEADTTIPEQLADGPFQATYILTRGAVTTLTENLQLAELLAAQGEVPATVAATLDRPGEALIVASEATIDVNAAIGTLSITTVGASPEAVVEFVTVYAETLTEYFDEQAIAERASQIETARGQLEGLDAEAASVQDRLSTAPEDSAEERLAQVDLDSILATYSSLQSQIRQLEAAERDGTSSFRTLQTATAVPALDPTAIEFPIVEETPPSTGGRRVLLLWTGLGFGLGLALGLALALLVDRFDPMIRTIEDAEDAFGLPVLASLPLVGDDMVGTELDHAYAHSALAVALRRSPSWQLGTRGPTGGEEHVDVVGTATELPASDERGRTLLVTAPSDGVGTSTTVVNLAVAYADAGLDVLVVDCSFSSPAQHRLVEQSQPVGLRDCASLTDIDSLVQPTHLAGVRIVPAGREGPAPARLLTEGHALVDEARRLADVVIVDTGPLLATNEAASLVGAVDAVLVLARLGRTATRDARHTTEQLARMNAIVTGVAVVSGAGNRSARGHHQGPGVAVDQWDGATPAEAPRLHTGAANGRGSSPRRTGGSVRVADRVDDDVYTPSASGGTARLGPTAGVGTDLSSDVRDDSEPRTRRWVEVPQGGTDAMGRVVPSTGDGNPRRAESMADDDQRTQDRPSNGASRRPPPPPDETERAVTDLPPPSMPRDRGRPRPRR